jgi:hypothetical protein
MAIESVYWKEELSRISKSVRPVSKPKRWTERAACIVERDLIIGCFIVRRLVELNKVSSRTSHASLDVFGIPVSRSVTKLNRLSIDRNYNWSAAIPVSKPVLYICNQCIHSYVSFVERGKDRNWSALFAVSDYDKDRTIWRIPMAELVRIFETAASDYPVDMRLKFDAKLGDYRVETD